MDIYRVTRDRQKPSYYQSKHQMSIHTLKSLVALLPYNKGLITKIEKALVGEFEDVTEEFIKEEDIT